MKTNIVYFSLQARDGQSNVTKNHISYVYTGEELKVGYMKEISFLLRYKQALQKMKNFHLRKSSFLIDCSSKKGLQQI